MIKNTISKSKLKCGQCLLNDGYIYIISLALRSTPPPNPEHTFSDRISSSFFFLFTEHNVSLGMGLVWLMEGKDVRERGKCKMLI